MQVMCCTQEKLQHVPCTKEQNGGEKIHLLGQLCFGNSQQKMGNRLEHQQETKAGLKFEQINDFPDVDLLSKGIQGYFQPCYWQAFKRNGKTCSLGL